MKGTQGLGSKEHCESILQLQMMHLKKSCMVKCLLYYATLSEKQVNSIDLKLSGQHAQSYKHKHTYQIILKDT
jgi:hypothetical protein